MTCLLAKLWNSTAVLCKLSCQRLKLNLSDPDPRRYVIAWGRTLWSHYGSRASRQSQSGVFPSCHMFCCHAFMTNCDIKLFLISTLCPLFRNDVHLLERIAMFQSKFYFHIKDWHFQMTGSFKVTNVDYWCTK